MEILTQTSERAVYSQLFDDASHLDALIKYLMNRPVGTSMTTTVTNNGHPMVFKTTSLDLKELVQVSNGLYKAKRKAPVRRLTPALARP